MEVVNKKIVLVVILMGIVYSIFIWQNISDKETKLEMVSLNNDVNSSNMFAIMLEEIDEEGNLTYVESSDDMWPSKEYKFNKKMSGCIDSNGNKIENALRYDLTNKIVSVKTEKTSYCYLYFSKPINLYELCENYRNLKSCFNNKKDEINLINNISDNIFCEMYRYQGTYETLKDNYICFGTSDTVKCINDTDKYMYRIIGINEEGILKIIKKKR